VISQKLIEDEEFKNRHKSKKEVFTRIRKLHFSLVVVLILQKSLKSLQLILNEMIMALGKKYSLSNSAFTQARANLKYTAFIELNKKAVIDVMYSDGSCLAP